MKANEELIGKKELLEWLGGREKCYKRCADNALKTNRTTLMLHEEDAAITAETMAYVAGMPTTVIGGDTSDGYHTFNELYHHRAVLFSVIVSLFPELSWKAKKHDDGSMYDGMFIVGIDTPKGQATYHYDLEPYWNQFKCKTLERAPKWDGHTPDEAIRRIGLLRGYQAVKKNSKWEENKHV